MTNEQELGSQAAIAALFAAIIREFPMDAQKRIEVAAKREIEVLPIALLAPQADTEKVRDFALSFVKQAFAVAAG